jgi:hypothetical protein
MLDRPNFSGVWRADFKRSNLEIESPQSTVIKIEHKDPQFYLTRTHSASGAEDTLQLRLTTDGQEHIHFIGDVEIRSRCVWDDDTLVFISRLNRTGFDAENVVRYRLEQDGKEIVADEVYRATLRVTTINGY